MTTADDAARRPWQASQERTADSLRAGDRVLLPQAGGWARVVGLGRLETKHPATGGLPYVRVHLKVEGTDSVVAATWQAGQRLLSTRPEQVDGVLQFDLARRRRPA